MNLIDALGWTLLHFLWQGTLIAALLAGILAFVRQENSGVRYCVSCAAMLLMLVCVTATFVDLGFMSNQPHLLLRHAGATLVSPALSAMPGFDNIPATARVVDYLPTLVWAWLGGVLALSVRSLGGWVAAERFVRLHVRPADSVWEERFAALAERLSISRPVRLAVSALAQVPAVVGWMRPVVLVPASVFTGLTAKQIEALLAHELAHVRRYDYLVNLLQTAAETLFFYHPAVWWVNRVIRGERENCCDDLAVVICGDTLVYVRALTELEQMRDVTPRLAMAADGGFLLARVQRLLGMSHAGACSPSGWIAGVGIAVCVLIAGLAANGFAQRPETAGVIPNKPSRTQQQTLTERQNALAGQREALAEQQKLSVVEQNALVEKQNALVEQQNDLVAQQLDSPAQQDRAPASASAKKDSWNWLDEIESEGYRNLTVDQLIAWKIHGVDATYIRQMRAGGLQPTADQMLALRIQGVTADFISELTRADIRDLKADQIIALKVQGADPAWIRQIQSLGFPNLSAGELITLRVQGVTPEFIREARNHFKDITLGRLIQLKRLGIVKTP